MFSVNINNNEITIATDDRTVEFCLARMMDFKGYIPWERKVGVIKKRVTVYSSKTVKTINGTKVFIYKMGIGWIGYLVNIFSNLIILLFKYCVLEGYKLLLGYK